MQLILISGLAGAGKTTAIRILEDSGYCCVDNLPPQMLLQLIESYRQTQQCEKFAVGINTSSHSLLRGLLDAINNLTELNIPYRLFFLEARIDTLITRYSETRRKHPLSNDKKTISDCILEEQEILAPLREISHRIDTSDLKANHLRAIIKQLVEANYSQLNVVIQSFGFKYGLPIDSDFVFDIRCLPNPYYDINLRHFDGTQQQVIEFLSKQPKVEEMLYDIYNILYKWLTEFSYNNRNYVTVSIGCTGGRHRSVYLANNLANLIHQAGYKTMVRHRQINLGNTTNH